MIELVFLCCYFVFEKKKSIQTFQIKFNFFFIAHITFLRRSSNNRTRIFLVRTLVVLSLVLETIEVVEKWKVIRLSFIREEKGTQDSFESNKLDSKNSMYVTERRNEIGEKLHARFVKIQRPTLFNRVLLPVDFHFDSILPSHLFIAIFPQDTKFHHCEDVSVRRNSTQFYAK